MAVVKISELPAMQQIAGSDILPIVDTSETETKKVTKQMLLTDIDASEVNIEQLNEATQINDEDYLIITQNGLNKKISKANARFASGDEISIGTTQPVEDEKLWIKSDETTDQARYKDGNTWKELSIKALDSMVIGSIIQFVGTTIPNGWLECDGSTITQSAYPELYDLIGGTLPDFRGRVLVGQDTSQTEFDTLLETGGEKTHTLTTDEMPKHNHMYDFSMWRNQGLTQQSNTNNIAPSDWDTHYLEDFRYTETTGGDQPHNILQPYAVVKHIIKAKNTTPTMASIVNDYNESTKDGYSCDYINGKTGVELWTNENPTSSFSAQDINIDLSSYSYIEVLYRDIIADPFIQSSGKIPVGYGNKTINHTWINGEGETLLFRVLRTTTSKVAFETGYSAKLTDATINTHNDCLIPYKIIGYK